MKDDVLISKLSDEISRSQRIESYWRTAMTIEQKWSAIRKIYTEINPIIFKESKKNLNSWVDPYFYDWIPDSTPIEAIAWQCIRGNHSIPMYPQYPALQYFIDFANPYLKIGVELDGATWHNEVKDRKRDARLVELGWKIYRISGSECNSNILSASQFSEEFRDDMEPEGYQVKKRENNEKWFLGSCDGVIRAISIIHFKNSGRCSETDIALARKSLAMHCYY